MGRQLIGSCFSGRNGILYGHAETLQCAFEDWCRKFYYFITLYLGKTGSKYVYITFVSNNYCCSNLSMCKIFTRLMSCTCMNRIQWNWYHDLIQSTLISLNAAHHVTVHIRQLRDASLFSGDTIVVHHYAELCIELSVLCLCVCVCVFV